MTDLIERLREQYGDPETGGFEYVNPDGLEAIARIEALTAQVVAMGEALKDADGAARTAAAMLDAGYDVQRKRLAEHIYSITGPALAAAKEPS